MMWYNRCWKIACRNSLWLLIGLLFVSTTCSNLNWLKMTSSFGTNCTHDTMIILKISFFLLHSTSVKKSLSLSFSFTLVRYLDRSDSWTAHSLHIHFWLILFFLFCSNGHAIWNRIGEENKKRTDEWNGLNMSQHQLERNH
jgi:hypothetical protein